MCRIGTGMRLKSHLVTSITPQIPGISSGWVVSEFSPWRSNLDDLVIVVQEWITVNEGAPIGPSVIAIRLTPIPGTEEFSADLLEEKVIGVPE